MEYYMKGLVVSTYLMRPHLECRRRFTDKINKLRGGWIYLDVGIGHGEYFALAIQHTDFE